MGIIDSLFFRRSLYNYRLSLRRWEKIGGPGIVWRVLIQDRVTVSLCCLYCTYLASYNVIVLHLLILLLHGCKLAFRSDIWSHDIAEWSLLLLNLLQLLFRVVVNKCCYHYGGCFGSLRWLLRWFDLWCQLLLLLWFSFAKVKRPGHLRNSTQFFIIKGLNLIWGLNKTVVKVDHADCSGTTDRSLRIIKLSRVILLNIDRS